MYKLLIVDAPNRITAMYRANSEDVVLRFLREVKRTSHLTGDAIPILCFDHPDGSQFRKDIWPEYKSHRDKSDPVSEEARQSVMDGLAAAKEAYCCWFDPAYEADDLIATLCTRLPDWPIAIHSGDRDMFPLIAEGCRMLIRNSTWSREDIEYMTPSGVLNRYKVAAHQWLDYRCMIGDNSDNVAGIPKVGEKTAKRILSACDSVSEAIASGAIDEVPGVQKFRLEALKTAYSEGLWSKIRSVLELQTDVTIPLNVRQAIDMADATPLDGELTFQQFDELQEGPPF